MAKIEIGHQTSQPKEKESNVLMAASQISMIRRPRRSERRPMEAEANDPTICMLAVRNAPIWAASPMVFPEKAKLEAKNAGVQDHMPRISQLWNV